MKPSLLKQFPSVILTLFLFALLSGSLATLPAQEVPAGEATQAEGTSTEEAPVTRAERLRQHEERVRRIIEDRRKARAESEGGEVVDTPAAQEEPAATSSNDFGNMILYNVFRVEEGSALVFSSRGYKPGSANRSKPAANQPTQAEVDQQVLRQVVVNSSRESTYNNVDAKVASIQREQSASETTNQSANNGSTRAASNSSGSSTSFNPESGQSGMLSHGDSKNNSFDYALDTMVRQGDRFVSEVRLQNSQAKEFDRFRIALQYDKRFLRPIRVFDQGIRNSLKNEPKFEIVDRDSLLVYEGEFTAPRLTKELVLLTIVWEAILPTEYTQINFTFAGGETEEEPHSGIYDKNENILGEKTDPFDGVLGGSILILKPFDPTATEDVDIVQGKKEELRNIYLENVGGQRAVGLQLIGPDYVPAVGETFQVDVKLNNPGGSVVDSLKFFVQFDPKVIQVVDQDLGNWIRRGVNVHDGPYRLRYPFDYHKYNEADNTRGRIRYAMSMGRTLTLPTGTFATIHFKALAPAKETSIAFVATQDTTEKVTDARILGYSVLSTDAELTTPELLIPILPEQQGDQKQAVARAEKQEAELPASITNPGLIEQLLELP